GRKGRISLEEKECHLWTFCLQELKDGMLWKTRDERLKLIMAIIQAMNPSIFMKIIKRISNCLQKWALRFLECLFLGQEYFRMGMMKNPMKRVWSFMMMYLMSCINTV